MGEPVHRHDGGRRRGPRCFGTLPEEADAGGAVCRLEPAPVVGAGQGQRYLGDEGEAAEGQRGGADAARTGAAHRRPSGVRGQPWPPARQQTARPVPRAQQDRVLVDVVLERHAGLGLHRLDDPGLQASQGHRTYPVQGDACALRQRSEELLGRGGIDAGHRIPGRFCPARDEAVAQDRVRGHAVRSREPPQPGGERFSFGRCGVQGPTARHARMRSNVLRRSVGPAYAAASRVRRLMDSSPDSMATAAVAVSRWASSPMVPSLRLSR